MIYTLDTNAVSAILKGDSSVVSKMEEVIERGDEVTLNAISYYETERGLLIPKHQRRYALFRVMVEEYPMLALTRAVLDRAAHIYQALSSLGTPLEDADTLIAAMAIDHDAVLVTDNTKHFARVPHLSLENWIERS